MFELALYLLSIIGIFAIIVSILFVTDWTEKVKPKSDNNRLIKEEEYFEE